jgi:hypothetical protein
MSNEKTYWGILCRACSEPVAFDIQVCQMFGPGAADRPGAIRCAHGHNHIYFPRNFQFFSSAVAITDAVMQENHGAYQAINPARELTSETSRAAWPV